MYLQHIPGEPITAKFDGVNYFLPDGFRVWIYQAPTLAGQNMATDHRGDQCDFKIINGQPCLISKNGVWDIFPDRKAEYSLRKEVAHK